MVDPTVVGQFSREKKQDREREREEKKGRKERENKCMRESG